MRKGHIAKNTLIREIKEELGISISLDNIEPFLIYIPVGKSAKHLAVCFVLRLDLNNLKLKLDSYELVQRTGKSKSGTFINVAEISNLKDEYEAWSIEILNNVFGKDLPQQQVLVFS